MRRTTWVTIDSGAVRNPHGCCICNRHARRSVAIRFIPARSPPQRGRRRTLVTALLIGGLAPLLSLASNLASAQEAVSIFGSAVPSKAVAADNRAVTLGVRFSSSRAGDISAIRFYRGARSPLGYVARLYTASGRLLTSVRLSSETGPIPGWQTAMLPTPISISADAIYIAAYYTPNGQYADDYLGMAKDQVHSDLRIPGNSTAGGNGIYYYGLGFPRYEWKASNYYVDVLFTPARQTPVLSLSFEPPGPSIAKAVRRGTIVATIVARWSDGKPFRGTFAFGPPYWNDGGAFAISGDKLVVNPNGPGVAAAGTVHVTIVATQ